MYQNTIFISDLHLSEHHPEITHLLTLLLNACDPHIHQLFILGDLFEFWIGDDTHLPFQDSIEQLFLEHTSRGLNIFFLAGNRDFLIGKDFFHRTGIQSRQEPLLLYQYNKTILLMHGDTLCTKDYGYQFLRFWVRQSWVQHLFLSLPIPLRLWIAKKLRGKDDAFTLSDDPKYDAKSSAIDTYLRKYPADYFIHGHTHRPDIHQHHHTQRIVLGAWDDQASIAVLDQNGILLKKIWDESSINSLIKDGAVSN